MKKIFDITGMTCAACAAHVEKAVGKLGIENVNVNLLLNRLTVESELDDAEIIAAVESAGYGAAVRGKAVKADPSAPTKAVDNSKALLIRFFGSLEIGRAHV